MAHYKGAASEGGRAMILMKKRQKEQEEVEAKKKKIEEELKIGNIQNKFATHYDAIEAQLKSNTIGLVTLDEMKAKQEDIVKKREKQLAKKNAEAQLIEKQKEDRKKKEKLKIANLSFVMNEDEDEDEEEEEEEVIEIPKADTGKKKRLGKNPDVDTSFLPDRDREEEENKLREQLREEWATKQEKLKNEEIEITYSYWDGSGHRRQVRMRKGNSIQQFLQKCLEGLRREFNDLKSVTVDQLMYVKEDLIIAQHYTFYDFIVTKARGKSGPLFNFDVHEDVRLVSDASVEKDESHAGKVCLRSWYERNKHIFPASRWEPYDPEKRWDSYTVSDKNAIKIMVK
ncbi:protein FAM50A-A-like [Mytilus galloprovincialis]|uniref:Protein FAM50 n=1 Tax=Mytilus galloprovincialis TaxID=29158 RepID=A0A8B6BRX2_MYTGA|nr:protein FAM50 [Mytilus galloprovincialis]